MKDLVCISHLRWDFVWQRPQQILSRLAKHYRVFFVEEPLATPDVDVAQLAIRTEHLPNQQTVQVIQLLQPMEKPRWIGHSDPLTQEVYTNLLQAHLRAETSFDAILWLYTPMGIEFAASLDRSLLVFDVMDQLSAFKGAPPQLKLYDKVLLRMANVVFTGGYSLYKDKKTHNSNVILIPSGVEVEHFAKAKDKTEFPRPELLKSLQGPILGYFGVIDERIDLELITKLAQAHSDWNIVMLGPTVKIDPAALPQAPNIHYGGMVRYQDLPAYLAHFDVALIPFALNEATRFLSPTKTLEYMAAHKPIVSTPIHDVMVLYGEVVHVAHTHQQFINHVEVSLREESTTRTERETALLAVNAWDQIALRMHKAILAQLSVVKGARYVASAVGASASQAS